MPQILKPVSPDPLITKEEDMAVVKFGHMNHFLVQINTNVFADNTAAIQAGLEKGDFYRTAAGVVCVVF